MNILLLGGTGAIGYHLSVELAKKNYDVYVTSRSIHKDTGRIKYIVGNAKDISFLREILSTNNWDSIVDFMCYSTKEFSERLNLLLSNTKQYVFLSSARVYSNNNEKITEDDERILDTCKDEQYLRTDEYALYKAREEDILLTSHYSNYTILRPYITYGENRIPLGVWEKETWLKRALAGKNIAMPRIFLDKLTSLAYGRDACRFIVETIANERCIGQIYNIVSHESQTWRSIANIYLDEINKINKSNIRIVEFGECCFSLKAIKKCLMIKIGVHNPNYGCYSWNNYQLIYDREFNRCFDNSKTIQLSPDFRFSPNDQNMRHCLRAFMLSPQYNYTNYYWEMVQDRITGEYTSLSHFPSLKLKLSYIAIRFLIPRVLIYSK